VKNEQLSLKALRLELASYPALIHKRVWIRTIKHLRVEKVSREDGFLCSTGDAPLLGIALGKFLTPE
jgi:hypothetical protein